MEFTVSKSDLVRELSLSQGVVEKKTTIPILSNVLLEAHGDRLYLTATDLELGLRTSCPAKIKREGSGTIPAKKLLDYVRLLPDAEITVKFAENHWASLTCGRSRTRIAGMSRESFPELPTMPETVAQIPAKQLSSMIARTMFAISMEESRFTLNGALLLIGAEGLTMVATDGHRLAYVQRSAEQGSNGHVSYRALVPRKAMGEITKLADDSADPKVRFAGDDNHLFFEFGPRLLITRKLTGNFPDYERVLPQDNTNIARLSKDEIKGAIERVAQFADERSRAIRVQFTTGEVKVFSSSVETGESEESVTSEYSGPDLEIGFNAQYLLDFLRAVSQDHVSFSLKDQKSAGELQPAAAPSEESGEQEQYRYVVMPMRI
ncbi:MAG TPA: DNA polymerase III subunit beta [Bryobacteraceae bacterium]|nr:DNA polymerase III subunit beta [Bryobacteraceae bacterium]